MSVNSEKNRPWESAAPKKESARSGRARMAQRFVQKSATEILNGSQGIDPFLKIPRRFLRKESVSETGDAVKMRLFFIRHGQTLEELEHANTNSNGIPHKQSDAARLSDTSRCQLEKVARDLKNAGLRPEDTYLFHCGHFQSPDGTIVPVVRVEESAEILKNGIGIPDNHVSDDVKDLDTTDPEDDLVLRIKERNLSAAEFAKRLRNECEKAGFERSNLIFIIHKSNVDGIRDGLFDLIPSHFPDSKNVSPGQVVTVDIMEDGKPLNSLERPDILRIDIDNYVAILEEVSKRPEWSAMARILNMENSQPLWEVQNRTNAFFRENPKLYGEFLNAVRHPDIQSFCIANLPKADWASRALENFCRKASRNREQLPFWVVQSMKKKKPEEYEKLRIRYPELFRKWEAFERSQDAYRRANEFQKWHTLDESLKDGNDGQILSRSAYFWKDSEGDSPGPGNSERPSQKVFIDFDRIIRFGGKYLLRSHVGQWKSFWLAEFVKHAAQNGVEVSYWEAKNLAKRSKSEVERIFQDAKNPGGIICIDAIDEIQETVLGREKEFIKRQIAAFSGSIVVTARESEYPDTNKGFSTLSLEPLDGEAFLRSRLGNESEKYEKVSALLKKQGLDGEIFWNPLLLVLVTRLANMLPEDAERYERALKIRPLEKIRNKADLYESVVRFILAEHQGMKGGVALSRLEKCMRYLGIFAYGAFQWKTSDQIICENPDLGGELEGLWILFRLAKSGNAEWTGEFDFIHRSFYEFFLARHLSMIPNGNREIYSKRDASFEKWNEWRDFHQTALFYGQILWNTERFGDLAEFLWEDGILRNDDIFGENFFLGLEIFYKLPELARNLKWVGKVFKKYADRINSWNIREVLKKSWQIKKFVKHIGYRDTVVSKRMTALSKVLMKRFTHGKWFSQFHQFLSEIGMFALAWDVNPTRLGVFSNHSDHSTWWNWEIPEDDETKAILSILDYAHYLGDSEELYCTLAHNSTIKTFSTIARYVPVLLERKYFSEVWKIFRAFNIPPDPKILFIVSQHVDALVRSGDFYEAWRIAKLFSITLSEEIISLIADKALSFVKSGQSERVLDIYGGLDLDIDDSIVSAMIESADILSESEDGSLSNLPLFLTLAQIPRKRVVQVVIKELSELVKEGRLIKASHIFWALIEESPSAAIEHALVWTQKWYLSEAAEIHSTLACIPDSRFFPTCMDSAMIHMQKNEINTALDILQSLVWNPNPQGAKLVTEYAKALLREWKSEEFRWVFEILTRPAYSSVLSFFWERAEVLLKEGKFEEAWEVCAELIERPKTHPKVISFELERAEKLMKEWHVSNSVNCYIQMWELPVRIVSNGPAEAAQP